jgi:Zn-dependent protease with chaperone function
MLQFLLIAIFASIFIHDGMQSGPVLALRPVSAVVLTLAGFVVLWLAFHLLVLWCGRVIDRTGKSRAVRTAERAMVITRLLGGAWWGFSVFVLGWLDAVRALVGDQIVIDELLTMSPFLALVLMCWWSIYPVENRLHEAILLRRLEHPDGHPVHPPLTRAQYIISGLRHQVLLILVPLTLMMAWQETLNFREDWIVATLDRLHAGLGPASMPIIHWIGTLAILLGAPAAMRVVWSTVRIGPGPLRDRVHAMCRRYRVRVNGPLLWRTHGALVNGAILGVVWPLRFMLLTDGLIEQLSEDQVEAVIAHEVAHVRRRHLIWLGVCVFATFAAFAWADELIVRHTTHGAVGFATDALGLVGVGLVFGLVSRRFEWQADAFAVQHLSTSGQTHSLGLIPVSPNPQSTIPNPQSLVTPEAVSTMTSALQAVADLNGVNTKDFTWRHGSILERQRRLKQLIGVPVSAVPIDRQVRLIKLSAILALAGSAAPMVWELFHRIG